MAISVLLLGGCLVDTDAPCGEHLLVGVVLVTSAKLEDVSALTEAMDAVSIVSKSGIQDEPGPAVRRAARR